MGSFVRVHLPQILARCRADPEEFANLQDKTYCLANFRQSYRFLMPKQSEMKPAKYWSPKLSAPFSDAGFWVTSEWVASLHTAHFVTYLVNNGIEPIGIDEDFASWAQDTVDEFGTTGSAPGGPRYRATPLGVAQNAFARYLLGSIDYEAFTRAEWDLIKEVEFEGACVYCGTVGSTTMDHVIPINRIHLGEHRLGNLVPACAKCNGKKSNTTFTDFLNAKYRDEPSQARIRIQGLEAHAAKFGYQSIEDHEGVGPLIEEARAKLKDLADSYVDRINRQLNESRPR